MESLEKSLKTSFVGAANQITQLYTNALNFQKQSYVHGYNQANRDTLEFILKRYGSNNASIPAELLEFLKNKLETNGIPFENGHAPKSEDTHPHNSETRQNAPFFKFDNGFSPSGRTPHEMEMPATGPGFVFVPPQQQNGQSQPSFNFMPNNAVPQMNHMQNPSGQDPHTVFTGASHDSNMKKRQFEVPSNSMEYSYPEYKKSRLIG